MVYMLFINSAEDSRRGERWWTNHLTSQQPNVLTKYCLWWFSLSFLAGRPRTGEQSHANRRCRTFSLSYTGSDIFLMVSSLWLQSGLVKRVFVPFPSSLLCCIVAIWHWVVMKAYCYNVTSQNADWVLSWVRLRSPYMILRSRSVL